jgi:hypothetical protein
MKRQFTTCAVPMVYGEHSSCLLAFHLFVVCALQRCTSSVGEIPTRPLSLRPEVLGAGQEATNGLKHSKKTPL